MKRILFLSFLLSATAVIAEDAARPVLGQFVRDWQVCGPFDAKSVIEPVVENEDAITPAANPQVKGRAWKTLKLNGDAIDFANADAFGPADNAVAFAFAEIESDAEGEAILGLGSDDSAMAWWNGRLVLVQDVLRGTTPGDDQIHLTMRKGRNTLLLKIYNEGGGWGCAADLRSANDRALAWRTVLPLNDDEFLDLVERKSFDYFWNEADPDTGLIPDGVPTVAKPTDIPCSVAVVGFGLTAICIGESRGWITRDQAVERVIRTLTSMLEKADQERGFFYHFIDLKTGKRAWKCELSSIDTGLFFAGALTCRNHFNDSRITDLVNALYRRVDWTWMLNGEKTLSMGWLPESGFIPHRWDGYSEHMVLYLIGMGAPSNALPAECWTAWKRPYYTYEGMTYVQAVPLFLNQFSHAWVDFRDQRDAVADYYRNSVLATKAHRDFCLTYREKFPAYSEDLWGLNPSKGPKAYMVWGGPPATMEYPIDGSVVPCGAGGSLAFTPELTIPVLRRMYDAYRGASWGRYGFIDAFNPNTGWVADGYLGIDVGVTLLMAENHRSGKVWQWFMDGPEIRAAMHAAGFKRTGKTLDKADTDYLRQLAKDTWDCIAYFVYPDTQMPYDSSGRGRHTSASNIGLYLSSLAVARDMGFITAEDALKKATRVLDSVEKFPTWKGFAQCWHGVVDLQPSQDDIWVSVVDTGNLGLGLAMAGQAFPELRERCSKLLDAMDWGAIYDAKANQLYGGYDMKNQKFNPDWRVDGLATDSRGAPFLAVGSGKVPAGVWDRLARDSEEQYGARFFRPGWTGGGLFMQYITGIFVDEKNTRVGRSAANLAYQNMRNADAKKLPAWGWSSCENPDGGYIGWGRLCDEVVTPHASVLALEDYPHEVVENLYALQRLGARAPWTENGKTYAFGFRDSVNLSNRHVCPNYLVLDQGLLFLSLANYLENGIVRRYFNADPRVKRAMAEIDDFAKPEGGPNVSVFEPGLGKLIAKEQVGRSVSVPRMPTPPAIDGDLSDWPTSGWTTVKFPEQSEFGIPPTKDRFEASFLFAWDPSHLYVAVKVKEDELVCEAPASELYKDDAIELFFDPKNDGFLWGNAADFQIGLSPSGPDGKPQIYSWFQKTVPPDSSIGSKVSGAADAAEYVIETRIPWSFLGVADPKPGSVVPGSLAVHTLTKDRASSAKINWSYRIEAGQIHLGELKLAE